MWGFHWSLSTTSVHRTLLGSQPSGLGILIFLPILVGIIGKLLSNNCLLSFPFLFHPCTEPFLWEAEGHMSHLKDLIWSVIMPWWVSGLWAELLRPADDLTRRKPIKATGNSKKWKKCENSKIGLWEEELQRAKGSMKCQNVIRGPIKMFPEERNPESSGKATEEVHFGCVGGGGIFHCGVVHRATLRNTLWPDSDFHYWYFLLNIVFIVMRGYEEWLFNNNIN